MNCLKKFAFNESGMALPLALVLLTVGAFLVIPVISLMTTNLQAVRQVDQLTKEYYSADAGIEMALWHVQYDPDFTLPAEGGPAWTSNFSLNDMPVEISISKQADEPYRVTSTATSPDGKDTTIDCFIQVAGATGGDVWDYALVSLGGDITMSGTSDTESDQELGGDCYANGNITLNGTADIYGNASATGTITTNGVSDIHGEESEGAEPLTGPIVDTNFYKNETLEGCSISCGEYTHTSLTIGSNQTFSTRVHVQNNLTIQSICTVVFNNTVCVDGNLEISGSTNVIFNGPVKVNGTIKISGLASVTFHSTVCSYGKFTLSSSKDIIFGNTVFVGDDLVVTSNIDVNLGGTVYVYGGIDISGNASFIGNEYVFVETGDLKLSGTAQLGAEEIPFFMAIEGDVNISGTSDTSAIIYAPKGNISISGTANLYGCAVGKTVNISGTAHIQYQMELRDRDDLPGRGGADTGESGLKIQTYIIH